MSQWVVCINSAATSRSVLYHTVRNDNGTDSAPWQNFWGDVMGQVGPTPGSGTIIDVKCDEAPEGTLQLIIRTSDGKIWHTVRDPSGSWQKFWGDVFGQSGTPTGGPIHSMTCSAGTDGTFQIGILMNDQKTVLHTVRNVDTTWQKAWGNETTVVGPLPGLVAPMPPPASLFAGG